MKKIIKFYSICLMITFFSNSNSSLFAQDENATQEVIVNAKMLMNIDGMSCAMGCARAIEVELNNIDGVNEAIVDFESRNAVLTYNTDLTSEKQLIDFVNTYRKGAYTASVVGDSNQSKKSCCSGKKESCSPEQKAKCAEKKTKVKDTASSSNLSSEIASSESKSSKKCTKSCCVKN